MQFVSHPINYMNIIEQMIFIKFSASKQQIVFLLLFQKKVNISCCNINDQTCFKDIPHYMQL